MRVSIELEYFLETTTIVHSTEILATEKSSKLYFNPKFS